MARAEGEESLERYVLALLDNGVPIINPQELDALLFTTSQPQAIVPSDSQARAIRLHFNFFPADPHLVVKKYSKNHLYKMTQEAIALQRL